MPSPLHASAPRISSTQRPRRTTLIELSPGKYTFEHAGVSYNVRLSPPPTDKLAPTRHRRLQTLLRIFTSQATADHGVPPKKMRLTPKGCEVNGKPYTSSQPSRVKHYLTIMGELFGPFAVILNSRH